MDKKGEREDFLRALTTKCQVLHLQGQRTVSDSNIEVNLKLASNTSASFQKTFGLNENLLGGNSTFLII